MTVNFFGTSSTPAVPNRGIDVLSLRVEISAAMGPK